MAPSRSRKRRRVKPPASAEQSLTKTDGSDEAEHDSVTKTSVDAGPGFPYFSLPAEIRNEITTLAVTGGEVYLKPRRDPAKKPRGMTKKTGMQAKTTPGAGFLATCRQAYEEAHIKYYTCNVFYLPPGSPAETESLLANIKPEHLAMIRHVIIKLSLEDLTPSVLSPVERYWKRVSPSGVPLSQEAQLCALSLYRALSELWQAKVYLARTKFFTGMTQLQILQGQSVRRRGKLVFTMNGRDSDGLFGDYTRKKVRDKWGHFENVTLAQYDSMVEGLIHHATNGALFTFQRELREGGWKGLKRQLVVQPARNNYLAGNQRW